MLLLTGPANFAQTRALANGWIKWRLLTEQATVLVPLQPWRVIEGKTFIYNQGWAAACLMIFMQAARAQTFFFFFLFLDVH